MMLLLVPPSPKPKCRFKLIGQLGRGSKKRAVYACRTCPYPNGDLPFITRPLPKEKS